MVSNISASAAARATSWQQPTPQTRSCVVGGAAGITSLAEIFPSEVRATGMSLVYAVGVAIFGGFGQAIVTLLIQVTGNPIAPAFYVMACSILTLVALAVLPEMRGKTLL